jgi:hypothetical protein
MKVFSDAKRIDYIAIIFNLCLSYLAPIGLLRVFFQQFLRILYEGAVYALCLLYISR